MKVGLIHFYGLGDNVVVFEALFALKNIFACEVVVFGNTIMQNLLRHCDFVDTVQNIGSDIANNITTINAHHLDYVILPNCTRNNLRSLQQTNAKVIITDTKLVSIFARCKTIPTHILPKYRRMSMRDRALYFVRKINPKVFDSKITTICLDKAKVQTTPTQKTQIKLLIAHHLDSHNLNKENSILILINPFNHAANHTLPLESYIEMMFIVGNMPKCIPIVATYPQIHQNFIRVLEHWQHTKQHTIPNLLIFQNDDDLLNLAALVEQMHYVISPSTGTIHLASNLCVPTIGLFSQYDIIKWRTRSNQYVILPRPKADMSMAEIEEAITQTVHILQGNITQRQ